ncbi:MAG: hypothetical protein Q8P95_01750 [bacterium]|nr:hypothetical protein [bacterium]
MKSKALSLFLAAIVIGLSLASAPQSQARLLQYVNRLSASQAANPIQYFQSFMSALQAQRVALISVGRLIAAPHNRQVVTVQNQNLPQGLLGLMNIVSITGTANPPVSNLSVNVPATNPPVNPPTVSSSSFSTVRLPMHTELDIPSGSLINRAGFAPETFLPGATVGINSSVALVTQGGMTLTLSPGDTIRSSTGVFVVPGGPVPSRGSSFKIGANTYAKFYGTSATTPILQPIGAVIPDGSVIEVSATLGTGGAITLNGNPVALGSWIDAGGGFVIRLPVQLAPTAPATLSTTPPPAQQASAIEVYNSTCQQDPQAAQHPIQGRLSSGGNNDVTPFGLDVSSTTYQVYCFVVDQQQFPWDSSGRITIDLYDMLSSGHYFEGAISSGQGVAYRASTFYPYTYSRIGSLEFTRTQLYATGVSFPERVTVNEYTNQYNTANPVKIHVFKLYYQ